MRTFGDLMVFGKELPFETTVRIKNEDLKIAQD
jgi:hypothetical protein